MTEQERVRWWKNGDHPNDNSIGEAENGVIKVREGEVVEYYRLPGGDGTALCAVCSAPMGIHGWVKGEHGGLVHPGDFILTNEDGTYTVEHPDPMAAAQANAEAAAAGQQTTAAPPVGESDPNPPSLSGVAESETPTQDDGEA